MCFIIYTFDTTMYWSIRLFIWLTKRFFELLFCIFAFISCIFRWLTFFFLTNEAYFSRTILISSILMSSILIFSILIFSILIDFEVKNFDDNDDRWKKWTRWKRKLDEMSFLINCYWRFQIVDQFCQIIAKFKAYIWTCRNLLTCID
jgi:hypothetical protein